MAVTTWAATACGSATPGLVMMAGSPAKIVSMRCRNTVSKNRSPRLIQQLNRHHITDLFPHMAPATPAGNLPPIDTQQVERFLDAAEGKRVMPWIGGVLDAHCQPDKESWRSHFIQDITGLLTKHPRLAGIHLNIEPWPSGHAAMLVLLDELDAALPDGTILSVAAYPPPTRWHPHPDVHWDEAYFREVAKRCDQLAVMMYDTSIRWPKFYVKLMDDWTQQVLLWAGDTHVLLGLPAYEDQGVGYHHPHVENLGHGLDGIHAGLSRFNALPNAYRGIAVYSHWTMDDAEWTMLSQQFNTPTQR